MRHIRMLGLCVIALLGLAVVAAAGTASAAEPEWGVCVEQKKGHYADSSCTTEKFKENKKGEKKYSGKYEWKGGAAPAECIAKKHGNYLTSACDTEKEKKGVPEEHKGKYEKLGPKFTGEGGAGILTAAGYDCKTPTEKNVQKPREDCTGATGNKGYSLAAAEIKVECASEHASGEATGTDEIANVSVRFVGCQTNGAPDTGPGLPAGEIQVNPLKGHLGYINKANHEVGVLLEPVASEGLFAEFEALGGVAMERVGAGSATTGSFYEEDSAFPGEPNGRDGVISPITPVNQMTRTFTQNYRVEDKFYECLAKTCGNPEFDNKDWINIPSKFEGGPLAALEFWQEVPSSKYHSEWSPSGEEVTNVNTVEGEAEIKA